jgi:hypothetical protein
MIATPAAANRRILSPAIIISLREYALFPPVPAALSTTKTNRRGAETQRIAYAPSRAIVFSASLRLCGSIFLVDNGRLGHAKRWRRQVQHENDKVHAL